MSKVPVYETKVILRLSVKLMFYLFLRDDDLGGKCVLRVWHRVIEEANASDNLTYLASALWGVRCVTIHLKI